MLACAAVACGAAVDDGRGSVEPPAGQGADIEQNPDTGQSSTPRKDTSVDAYAASAACGIAPSGTRRPSSQRDFEGMIVGAWQLCGDSSVFGTAEAGLLIDADGTWAKLTRLDDQLTALHGWNEEGRWETIDTTHMNGPGAYQLNLSIDGSGTVITMPQFAAEPDLMRLDNHGVFHGDYTRIE